MNLPVYEVMFMPWADIRKDLSIGPFSVWAWAKSRVKDTAIADHLDEYFKAHVDHYDQPVSSITILSVDDTFSEVPPKIMEQARVAVDCLLFAEVYPAVKAAVRNDNRSMPPPSADRYQLVKQRFTPGDTSFAVSVGGAMHAGKIGKLKVTSPWDLGGFSFPDDELLTGLAALLKARGKAADRQRILRSLEWFRLAHMVGDGASLLTKVVMMSTAFEILLNIPEGPGKTQKFIQFIEDRISQSKTKRSTRAVTKMNGRKKKVSHTLPGWWANDFYDLRSRVVHGDSVKPKRLKYQRWLTHLIVADVVFGECLERELYNLNLIGSDLRKSLRACSKQHDTGVEQALTNWVRGYSEVHRQLGWSRK